METTFLPVFGALPKPTREQEASWSTAGQRLHAEAGITLAHEGATHAPELEVMRRATAAGANVIDVVAYPFMTGFDPIATANPVSGWGVYHDHFKIGGVKITADGSPQGKTAYFTKPYLTGGPGGEKDWRGEPTMPQETLNALVKRVYDWGVPLIIHTNGDATIDMLLEACEFARAGDYSRPWNVTTIHTQFMRKDHIAKFVKYGIRPSFYTLHTFYFATDHTNNRGPEQAAYISPMRDAIDAGLHPTNHADFRVAPLDQMFMAWSAYGEEDRRGSLEAGKIADLSSSTLTH
jgi:predicted amidohydrolase YtcJ